jgi:hypothetical protein
VLPWSRNFGRKAQKGPKKNLVGPGKSGAELLPDLSKKRPNFLKVWFFIKSSIFPVKTRPINWFISFFLTVLDHGQLKKLQNWPL